MINWQLASSRARASTGLTRAATESTPLVPTRRSRWGRSVRGGSFDAWSPVQDRSDATLPVASCADLVPTPGRRAFRLRSARERIARILTVTYRGHVFAGSRILGVRLGTVTLAGRLPSPWSRGSLA